MKRTLWLLGLLGLSLARGDELSARLIVLANSRQPESVALARFYAEQRDIPEANLIALPLPVEESITWRQFIDEVWQPLQDELYRRGWIEGTASSLLDPFGRRRYAPSGHHISYLVTCRGVPLRIHHDPTLPRLKDGGPILEQINRNEAAVDAELSLLAMGNHEIAGLVGNPLFAQRGPLTLDAAQVVKVARLDGPTWESARRLVSSALAAESSGLIGRYYLDLRGPHAEGDKWLQTVRGQLDTLGFPGDTEETAATWPAEARFDRPVFYFGWYADNLNGPFAHKGFAFPAGAVAVHIHSFSARTLHAPAEGWCGPLVARGVTATVGNVFEPFLEFTHRPNLLLRALSEGRNFGDASYYALPVLSWQAVAVGDPLYRPFQVGLEEQLEQVDLLVPELAALVRLRQANVLALRGQKEEAIKAARAARLSAQAAGAARLAEEFTRRIAEWEKPVETESPTVLVK